MKGVQSRPEIFVSERALAYAVRAIRLYQSLAWSKDRAGWIIGRQYLRAATSIGANIEDAQSGESRADFIHKLAVAQKEARESHYWLRLLAESGLVAEASLQPLMHKTEDLISVVTAIIVKTKNKGEHS
jgi:four helix bundle protein